jgi:hypothetical protein
MRQVCRLYGKEAILFDIGTDRSILFFPPYRRRRHTMSALTTKSLRRYVLTGSVAAITATGAWYGAGLKTQQERDQVG